MNVVRSPAALLSSAIGPLLLMASSVHALQILGGDPTCDGISMCTIDNIDAVTSPVEDETYEIVLRDMKHLEIFDEDGFNVTVFFGVSNPISNPNNVDIQLDFAFSDMNGDPVGPAISGSSVPLAPGEGAGNPVVAVDAPQGGSFVLHDFEVFLTCDGCTTTNKLNTSNIDHIEIGAIGATSRVGFWVPEPSALALWFVGALLLSSDRRRLRSHR
jgi:hypothetical protein